MSSANTTESWQPPRYTGTILGGWRRELSAASPGNKLGGLGRFVELFRSAKGSGALVGPLPNRPRRDGRSAADRRIRRNGQRAKRVFGRGFGQTGRRKAA